MKLVRSFSRFAATGLASATVDYGLFWLLRGVMPPGYASALSMSLSLVVNFTLNRTWAFSAKGRFSRSAALYLLLFGFNLAISSLAVGQLSRVIDDRIAKLAVMLVISFWNFILYRKSIFK